VGLADPLGNPGSIAEISTTGVRCFALELLPRITRAQSMDALSSQATVAGMKAALLAATAVPRLLPMMTTAAGTIPPARAFVIGAGVAGLQAIATARRLGAVVQAYDVRPTVREQVESLGARFLDLPLQSAEGAGGYAKAMDESFYRQQRELMAKVVAESDVVIATAAVPGASPPLLITADMVRSMPPGSVIVDLAARAGYTGGNCELTRPDETVVIDGMTILGPTNLAATVPQTASQLYARNMAAFVLNLVKDRRLVIDMDDDIVRETIVCDRGQVIHPKVRSALGLAPMESEARTRSEATA
jgi:NAD(P) transhydrogenase subunit alpha